MIRRVTQALILVTLVVWIGWDIFANPTDGATESEVIRDWQLALPGIAWGIGVLFGHFVLLSKRRLVPEGKTGPIAIGALSAVVIALTLLVDLSWQWIPRLGLGGAIAGHFLWSQKPLPSGADDGTH